MRYLSKSVFFAFLICYSGVYGQLLPYDLRCEQQTEPQAVEARIPVFTWKLKGKAALRQGKVWIRMSSDKQKLNKADMWQSAAIQTQECKIAYNGKEELRPTHRYWWQIRVEDEDGKVSPWSQPASFSTGLTDPKDWNAHWICAPWEEDAQAPLFRKNFKLRKKPVYVQLFCSGLGYFEAKVNDQKVSDEVLIPNQTNYGVRAGLETARVPIEGKFRRYSVNYLGFDVSKLVKEGENNLDILLGNGFFNAKEKWVMPYGKPRLLAHLRVRYADGSEEIIGSDTSWWVCPSPIVMNGIYQGEHYDARINPQHFLASKICKAPEGELCAQTGPSDKIMERFNPVRIERLGEDHYRVSFPEEISGWVRLTNIRGDAGHKIEISYLSESPQGTSSYICNGNRDESYAPRFSWFVFSQVEIKGWIGKLEADDVQAEAVYSDVKVHSSFKCSVPLFEKIDRIWLRSQKDNMHGGIASDCPHRERSGYTGDGQVCINTCMYRLDARQFYRKWIRDIIDAQNPETGYVPNGAPWQPGCGGGPAWGAAVCIMPWEYHLFYNDYELLREALPAMKAYLNYLQQWKEADGTYFSQAPEKGKANKWLNLGDWCTPGMLPDQALVHTFYAWMCADITAKTCLELGNTAEMRQYQSQATSISRAFIKKFYRNAEEGFGPNGGNVFALYMGLPANLQSKVKAALAKEIEANRGHLSTGIFGTRYLFEVLAENGMNELAFTILNKTTYPSYGHWIHQGATTTWEKWNGKDSRNHPMFGGGLTWFYKYLCGVSPLKPGFKSIQFKPIIPDSISEASYALETSYGTLAIQWKKEGERLRVKVTVPRTCQGVIYLPIRKITKDELNAQGNAQVMLIEQYEDMAEFQVLAGEHELVGY